MRPYYHPMLDRGNHLWALIAMLVWVAIVAAVVVMVVKLLSGHTHSTSSNLDPLGIIKERYARGEIKKEEFEQLKKDLK